MSAFVCNDKTINWIVGSMQELSWMPKLLKEKTPAERGQMLFDLNLAAVRYRYGERAKQMEREYIYSPETCSKCQALKSIGCLLYQCEEGDIPETELFKNLRKYEMEFAHYIVRDLPEYGEAIWG